MKKKVVLLVLIIVVAIIAIYFSFFYVRKCSDKGCFNSALLKCSRVRYLNDVEDATWFYKIKGKKGNECEVYVELKKLKSGTTDLIKLEGKNMICYLPFGYNREPQDNLAKCHGLLKEEMQSIIINKLHNYVINNLGEISEGLRKVL